MMRLFFILFCFCFSPIFANPSFLLVSDIHYGAELKEGQQSDSGPRILDAALKKIEQLSASVDFILNLGDLPAHLVLSIEKKGHDEEAVFHGLYQADKSQKPMFYLPGNNDSLGGNYQPFKVKGLSPLNFAKEWDGACVYCKSLLIDKKPMYQEGYYSSYVIPGNKEVILIALNTASFVQLPFWQFSYWNQKQAAEAQLAWLEGQLKNHKAKQLLIAMHVPPGMNYKGKALWREDVLAHFISILEAYSSRYEEMTLVSGHTHMDELRQLVLPGGKVIYDYSVPSISRTHHNNPGIKVITLNKDLAVSNYTTFYTSSLTQWHNEHYSAQGTSTSIFPQCHCDRLASCLNGLTQIDVCSALEEGLFYGVKSNRIHKKVCGITYEIRQR